VIEELGLEHWIGDGLSHGRAAIVPEMWVPGTEIVRIGVLAALADVIAGQPPTGPVSPTTDINVLVARVRPMRSVALTSRVLKAGRTLFVAETLLTADDEAEPFATSLATFMNRLIAMDGPGPHRGGRPPARLTEPLHARIGARVIGPGSVELSPQADINNDVHGTVLGGVTAMLAELAAESALAAEGMFVATDLDIRFLNRVKVGPVRATTRMLVPGPQDRLLGVAVVDAGDGERPIAYATVRCVRP
jgi:acyl-coenzyme A thioesterase PaaI-like protein